MVSGKNSGGEKWRKSWTHSPRHPPPATTPLTTGHIIGRRSTFSLQSQCFHEVWAHSENSAPLSGRTVGSAVGNPGEQGGEQGGEPQGARWGAGWGIPGERGGEPRGARWGTPRSGVGNPRERGGEHCEGTPSGSHNTTLKKTKDLQNGHTREFLTPERKLPSTSSTLHISLVKHSTGSTIVDTHQARTETPTTTKHHTIRAQLCTPNAS